MDNQIIEKSFSVLFAPGQKRELGITVGYYWRFKVS